MFSTSSLRESGALLWVTDGEASVILKMGLVSGLATCCQLVFLEEVFQAGIEMQHSTAPSPQVRFAAIAVAGDAGDGAIQLARC